MAAEKDFENKVKRFLTEEGCWFYKTMGNGFTRSGVPDLLCCVNGLFVGIELKASNGKPSDLQKRQIKLIKAANGIALVLYPKEFEEFKIMIKILKGEEKDGTCAL